MKIVFLGTIGIYHPILAAHLYLGRELNDDNSHLSGWGDFSQEDSGYPILVGQDSLGNQVYALGAGIEVTMTRETIKQLVEILGHSPDELLIKTISVQTEIALIYLYRMAALRILQKPINAVVARLLRPEYASLQRQVDEFKAEARFS